MRDASAAAYLIERNFDKRVIKKENPNGKMLSTRLWFHPDLPSAPA